MAPERPRGRLNRYPPHVRTWVSPSWTYATPYRQNVENTFTYLFIYLFTHFDHDSEKAKEKIDSLRDSTTERGSKLSAPGPNKF